MAKTETIEIKLYDWSVNMVFYPNSHQYRIEWQKLLSVSTICGVIDKSWPLIYRATNLAKEYLLWLKKEEITDDEIIEACSLHRKKKEEAADIGSQAHDWIERYTRDWDISMPDDERVLNAITWFLEREKQHEIQYIHHERMIYSRYYGYVWKLDSIAMIDWRKMLLDFKTSNKIRLLEYGMQTSAYCRAYEEETGELLDWILILKIPKEEVDKNWEPLTFETLEVHDIDWFFKTFIHAFELKKMVQEYNTY